MTVIVEGWRQTVGTHQKAAAAKLPEGQELQTMEANESASSRKARNKVRTDCATFLAAYSPESRAKYVLTFVEKMGWTVLLKLSAENLRDMFLEMATVALKGPEH